MMKIYFIFLRIKESEVNDLFSRYGGEYEEEYYFHTSNILDSITSFLEGDPFWWLRRILDLLRQDEDDECYYIWR